MLILEALWVTFFIFFCLPHEQWSKEESPETSETAAKRYVSVSDCKAAKPKNKEAPSGSNCCGFAERIQAWWRISSSVRWRLCTRSNQSHWRPVRLKRGTDCMYSLEKTPEWNWLKNDRSAMLIESRLSASLLSPISCNIWWGQKLAREWRLSARWGSNLQPSSTKHSLCRRDMRELL